MRPLNASLVGLGSWAKVIAQAAARSEEIHIVRCYSRSEETRRRFSDEFGIAAAQSYEEVLADPDVEAVLVTVPNEAHAEYATRAAQAGKHVFVEKPIANSLREGWAMAEAAQRAGVTLMVGHSARFLGGSRRLKALLEDGVLGDVVMAEANFSNDRALRLTLDEWRFQAGGSPGGPLTQIAVHQFDVLHYLLGPFRRVFSLISHVRTSAEVPDVTQTVIELRSGQMAYVGSSWISPATYFTRLYGTRANAMLEVDLHYWAKGDQVDAHSRVLLQRAGTSALTAVEFQKMDMYRAELEEFARAVRTGRAPEVTAEVGLHAVAALQAAIESSVTGRAVQVEELLGAAREPGPQPGF